MAWSADAARPLTEAFDGAPGSNAGGIPLPGHDHRGEPPHWDRPLAAAGGVEATIGDLARYASACLRPPPARPAGSPRPCSSTRSTEIQARASGAVRERMFAERLDLRIGFVPSGQVSGLSLLSPRRP